jgi:hypothetical protein
MHIAPHAGPWSSERHQAAAAPAVAITSAATASLIATP